MEDEYSSDVNMFVNNGNNNMPPPPQMQQPVMNQQPDMPPQMFRQQFQPNSFNMYNQHIPQSIPQTPIMRNFNPIDNFNTKENVLSVLVIVILFMIFASQNFRKLLSGIPIANMINGEYNFATLFIVGIVFALIYTGIKLFVF